jgi:lipid II:glycine glycyltransferase (peptidoglycan interpeptide bridge formation enzyme)
MLYDSPVSQKGREQILFQEVKEKEAWNSAVRNLGGSVLQSWEWGEFRRRGGWEPLRLLAEDGRSASQVLFRKLPAVGPLAYVPHGPLYADRDELEGAAEATAEHARERGAFTLRVEPRLEETQNFSAAGFVKSQNSFQPRCTLIVPILEDPDEQLKALTRNARHRVRKALRESVEAGPSNDVENDLEEFLDLLEETAGRQQFAMRSREYYRQAVKDLPAHLVLARREGNVLSGAIIITFGEEAYYLYGASRSGKTFYAPYLAQHEALSVARQEGARRYDMWGVPCEPHEGHPLWGVYQFKEKFGKEEERHVGAYEKNLSSLRAPLAHASIRGYYALQKLRRKSSGSLADYQ